jgi:hypothetical protein
MRPLRASLIILLFFTYCKSEDVPVVTTVEVSNVTRTSISCEGMIVSQGDSEIDLKGICWSSNYPPTIKDLVKIDTSKNRSFFCELTSLILDTKYFIRAFATNSFGTGYGKTVSFKTLPPSVPELITYWGDRIRCTSARSGGEITSNGDSPIIDCGVCWSTNENPTLSSNFISAGSVTDKFRIFIPGLDPNTEYYVRAYAINNVGTGYGDIKQFTTCLDINSNPVNPVTITLWDKPLDTIRHYIQGKWRIVVVRGGVAGINMCYNDFYTEFTGDDKYISNVYMTKTDTFLIDWVEQVYNYSTTHRMDLKTQSGSNLSEHYIFKEIKYDSLIYHDALVSDKLYYYGIKEE